MNLSNFFLIATSVFIGVTIETALRRHEVDYIASGIFSVVFLILYVATR